MIFTGTAIYLTLKKKTESRHRTVIKSKTLQIFTQNYILLSHLIYACEIWGQNQNNTLF